jgi:hypothetical protein
LPIIPVVRRAESAVSILVGAVLGKGARYSTIALIQTIFSQFLVKGIAIDSQPSGSFDLDTVTGVKNLLDQFALNSTDDLIMKVICMRPGGANTPANKLCTECCLVISSTAWANWPRRGLASQLRRQVFDVQFRSTTECYCSFHIVLELADIARPVMVTQCQHCVSVNSVHLTPILLGVALEEKQHKWLNILAPFT